MHTMPEQEDIRPILNRIGLAQLATICEDRLGLAVIEGDTADDLRLAILDSFECGEIEAETLEFYIR